MQGEKLVRTVRLASGLVLMAFVTCHLANLAIGIRSLAEMEAWRELLTAPWTRSKPLFFLLEEAAHAVAEGFVLGREEGARDHGAII